MTDPKTLTDDRLPTMHGYLMHRLLDLPERQWRTLVPEIEDYARACVSAALATREQTASTGGPVAWRDVLAERRRQVEVEGWTPAHDDEHGDNSMAVAAACYALAEVRGARVQDIDIDKLWGWTGWARQWFKPKDKRRNLVRAGALILAEIERLDRYAAPVEQAGSPGPAFDANKNLRCAQALKFADLLRHDSQISHDQAQRIASLFEGFADAGEQAGSPPLVNPAQPVGKEKT